MKFDNPPSNHREEESSREAFRRAERDLELAESSSANWREHISDVMDANKGDGSRWDVVIRKELLNGDAAAVDNVISAKSRRDALLKRAHEEALIENESQSTESVEPKTSSSGTRTEKENFDEGWDRIWGDKKTKDTPKPAEQATGNWQDEAIKNYTGKILDAELVPIHSSSKEPVDQPVGIPHAGQEAAFAKFESPTKGTNIGESRPVLSAEQIKEQAAKNAEVRMAAIELGIKRANSAVEARAEKINVPLGVIGRVSETWNKLPRNARYLLAGGLIASAAGAVVLGPVTLAGTAGVIGTAMRGLGAARFFVTFEKMLRSSHEAKTGVERSKLAVARHTVEAAALAIAIGAILPNVLHGALSGIHAPQAVLDTIMTFGGGDTITGTQEFSTNYTETAVKGSTVWDMAKHQAMSHYGEEFTNLSPEKQTYFIDAIKDQIEQHPNDYGMTDANTLAVGQNVDFSKIFEDKEFMNETLSGAKNFSPADIATSAPSMETPPRIVSPEEFLAEPKKVEFPPTGPFPTNGPIPITDYIREGFLNEGPHHANALVESGDLKGSFQYAPNGKVEGFVMDGGASQAEAQKILNPNWQEIAQSHSSLSGASLDTAAINLNATKIAGYEQMLDSLEQKGAGNGPEAGYLRDQIDALVTNTEKTYGNVFEDTIASNVPSVAPELAPSDPQILVYANEVTNDNIKLVFGKEGGLFGFGSSDGQEVFKNFADKPVDDFVGAKAPAIPTGDAGKLQGMLEETAKQTHVKSMPGEKVEDYLHRAAAINIERFKNNG